MIVEIIDSILSKVSNKGASGNDAFIKTFQELGVLGRVEYNYEQKMGKYCTLSDEFYNYVRYHGREYVEVLYFGRKDELYDIDPVGAEDPYWGIFFFNEDKDWKDYMFLVKILGPYKEYLELKKKREWADSIWRCKVSLPKIVKEGKPSWGHDYDGRTCVVIGASDYTWASGPENVDLFMLYPNDEAVGNLEDEHDMWLIRDIDILKNTVTIETTGKKLIEFELFNQYQLANWTNAQLAEYLKILQKLIIFPPF